MFIVTWWSGGRRAHDERGAGGGPAGGPPLVVHLLSFYRIDYPQIKLTFLKIQFKFGLIGTYFVFYGCHYHL